ncbi:MAG: cyclase family protein [Patescibacteria group bacterium]|nr:cyclase family protein [Actinomycetota bacterium]MCL5410524.1 cyclase family protein [Patescibacteria group bacterium]
MKKYIDLSVTLNENTPVYPGDPKFSIKPAGVLEKDGYEDYVISFGTHNGTHIDAARHMVKNGKSINEYPIDKFTGNGICIDVTKKFNLETIKNANIQKNDIVLFYTGMSDVYHKPDYYNNHPAITEEIANYLISKKQKWLE